MSRELDPANSAVLTIGHIHGGTTHNIISDSCLIQGTIRAKSPQARAHMEDAFRRICAGVALSLNTRIEVNYQRGVPPLMNDDALIDALEPILRTSSASRWWQNPAAVLARKISRCLLSVCRAVRSISALARRDDHLHNSDYQPDERSIHAGTQALARIAIDLLS